MKTTLIIFILTNLIACHHHKNFKQEDGYLKFADSTIHYKISGKGKPVLLLHAGGLNLDAWDDQIKDLNNNNFQTLRYSELGHGKTTRGKTELKGYEIIDKFIEEKFAGQKVSIIGLSWGGVLATDYALNYPNKVDKLILVSSGINGWDWFANSGTKKRYEVLREAYIKNDSAKVAELNYQYWIVGPNRKESTLDSAWVKKMKNVMATNVKNHWGEQSSALDNTSSINRLQQIQTPTLIVLGEKDSEDIGMIAKIYHSGIKNSKLVTIPDAGHSMNIEKPKEFNQLIIDFLNQ